MKSKLKLLKNISIILSVIYLINTVSVPICRATSNYTAPKINAAIVDDPLVYNYLQCSEKYGFCSCELIGTGIDITPYDKDGDGSLDFIEMREARNDEIFSDEQIGDKSFLACHYETPSAGPYSVIECQRLFGDDDCVCMSHRGLHYGQCYSRSIAKFSPEPISVPEAFCSHRSADGFENCICDEHQLDAYLGGDLKCYVMPEEIDNNWECLTEGIRIFSGTKYTCRTKDGTVFRPECCPGDGGCIITEYDPGTGTLSQAITGASILAKGYATYQGYQAAQAASQQALQMFGEEIVKEGIANSTRDGLVKTTMGNYTAGMASSPWLGTLTAGLFWIGLAIAVYTMVSGMFMNCKPGEFELMCKAEADLCIYTGKECVDDGPFGCHKEVKIYMCFSSQIAKVINEYGLPQIYAPGCHAESCNAAVDRNACGCLAAYRIDDEPTAPRTTGFSVDEFQRLDFGQIPISETLRDTMFAGNEDVDDFGFKDMPQLTDPSLLLNAEAEGSVDDQAPETGTGGTGTEQYLGGCTYNPDGSVKWPIDAGDFQIFDQSTGTPIKSFTNICIASPLNESGQIFAINYSQANVEAERLLLPDPSIVNATTPRVRSCDKCYTNDGWGGLASYAAAGALLAGGFTAGVNCADPVQIDEHFYDTSGCLRDSYVYKQYFVKNTIDDKEHVVTLPEQYWFHPTIEVDGSTVPARHWREYWVYWLPETDIQRGEWVAIEGKCFLKDTGAEQRQICDDTYQTCFNACGDNDVCKQTCYDDHVACIEGQLGFLSPPSIPRATYVDISAKPEYVPPQPDEIKHVYIDSNEHVEFDRPETPVYSVVDISGHAELVPPEIPKEVTVDLRAAGGVAIPADYDPLTGESLLTPGTFFKDSTACQAWRIDKIQRFGIDAYLTNKCEAVATGKLITDVDYYIARVIGASMCPPGYAMGSTCWADGNDLYNAAGFNSETATYFKDDPICQTWYLSEVASRKLDVTLNNNCTITANSPPAPNFVHTFVKTCPDGFTDGVDCETNSIMGRQVYDANGMGVYESISMDNDPVCTSWYQSLVDTYGVNAHIGVGCFLQAPARPAGPTTFYTDRPVCNDIPGFTNGVDCFDIGTPVYDENGYDAIGDKYFKDETICQDWFNTYIVSRNIDAVLSNTCTLLPPDIEEPEGVYTQFDVILSGVCPDGFTDGVDCFQQGGYLYDPVTGYSEKYHRFFSEDPICATWFETEIRDRGIDAVLEKNCTITADRNFGTNMFALNTASCPDGTIDGDNCFCECPALIDDILNDQMICPRPNKNNMLQRTVVHNSTSSAFNHYNGRPDVQTRYEFYLP